MSNKKIDNNRELICYCLEYSADLGNLDAIDQQLCTNEDIEQFEWTQYKLKIFRTFFMTR